jgi:hypothetical protein
MSRLSWTSLASCAVLAISLRAGAEDWKPAAGPLKTRWTDKVDPSRPHPEYPRPQLVRKDWINLNGLWEFAVVDGPLEPPRTGVKLAERILVPFPVESALSGLLKRADRVLYRRLFTVPEAWAGRRVLLHFGAVDWEARVWVNGKELGSHRGGYDAFSFDITDALRPSGEQELAVAVADPTSDGTQPRGKQVKNPHGIWYTPTSGIWQTVWLEPVAASSIEGLKLVPDLDSRLLRLTASVRGGGAAGLRVRAVASAEGKEAGRVEGAAGAELELGIGDVRPWSPEKPFLYDLRVVLEKDGAEVDAVDSYFGMRKVSLGKDADGVTRILLNNEFVFQFGPLDQGFWPDGLYTAPSDEALRYDIELTKKLGFNMARKHVKVEPERWYYWCDRLGLLVWQDMPSGDAHSPSGGPDIQRSQDSARVFEAELKRLVDGMRNHPSIVLWVVFNEGWGQYDTERLTKWVKDLDPSRLVTCASGWNDRPAGDVIDIHSYPGPAAPRPEAARAAVLGEFGGLGLPLRGHTWQSERNWGYRSFTTAAELEEAYLDLVERLRPLVRTPGLSAAVYTQTTDVEIEVNGLLTYDREVVKMDLERVARANQRLYLPPPLVRGLVATSQEEGVEWRYRFEKPEGEWQSPSYDDSSWAKGPGGFGTRGTPGAVVRSEWRTPEIWIRRRFELPERKLDGEIALLIHHDEDAEVYLNGVLAARATGYTTDYGHFRIRSEAKAVLKPGANTIAVHCRQTRGGQYIDVGLVEVVEVER